MLGSAELHLTFSSVPKNGSDIHRLSNRKWVLTICTLDIRSIPKYTGKIQT